MVRATYPTNHPTGMYCARYILVWAKGRTIIYCLSYYWQLNWLQALKAVESAIISSPLGLNPTPDGQRLIAAIPP